MEKEREQKAIRLALDSSNKDKLAQEAIAYKEALDFDLAVLDEYMRQEQEEKEVRNRRKLEWKQELFSYREHLRVQRQVERDRDAEIERLHKIEQDRVWATRAAKWQREHRARDKLMREVMESRQGQLQEKLERVRMERADNQEIKRRLEAEVKRAKEDALHKEQERAAKGAAYKEFLLAQIQDQHERAAAEEARLQREEQEYLVSGRVSGRVS